MTELCIYLCTVCFAQIVPDQNNSIAVHRNFGIEFKFGVYEIHLRIDLRCIRFDSQTIKSGEKSSQIRQVDCFCACEIYVS